MINVFKIKQGDTVVLRNGKNATVKDIHYDSTEFDFGKWGITLSGFPDRLIHCYADGCQIAHIWPEGFDIVEHIPAKEIKNGLCK